jgi:hypothetical protein
MLRGAISLTGGAFHTATLPRWSDCSIFAAPARLVMDPVVDRRASGRHAML